MKKEVDNCLKLLRHYDKCLKGTEWAVMEELSRFLTHFQDFTDLVSTTVTSLSLIQLIRKEIADSCNVDSRDCEEVAALKQAIRGGLDKRLPLNDSVVLATLLDPSTKDLLNMEQGEKMQVLFSAVRDHMTAQADVSLPTVTVEAEESPATTASHDDESRPISKRRRLLQKHRVDVPAEDAIRAEITS